MHAGIKQSKKDLDYAKFQLDTLIALMSYEDINMIKYNKNRALCSIECLEEVMRDTKEFIESIK